MAEVEQWVADGCAYMYAVDALCILKVFRSRASSRMARKQQTCEVQRKL